MQSLPTHRQFLTSLIDSLAGTSTSTQSGAVPVIPPDRRQLLLTLHVLFPTLVLPAFDLLDRRLVTRLHAPALGFSDDAPWYVYTVQSQGPTQRRHRRRNDAAPAPPSKIHVVRMAAWNCSCESFTYDSFPARMVPGGGGEREEPNGWSLGGMSTDGLAGAGEDVPCCKHTLACLLIERWAEVLGAHVESREVSKEELVGTLAGVS